MAIRSSAIEPALLAQRRETIVHRIQEEDARARPRPGIVAKWELVLEA
jgi:hypothetical protein